MKRSTSSRRNANPLALLSVLSQLPGCTGSGDGASDIHVDDPSALSAAVRLSWTIFPDDLDRLGTPVFAEHPAAPAPADAPTTKNPPRRRNVSGSLAIDAEAAVADSNAHDSLKAGELADFDSSTFLGPTSLKVDSRLDATIVALRGGLRVQDRYALEGMLGATWFGVRGTISDGAQSQSISAHDWGLYLGGEASARPFDSWTLYARFGGSLTVPRTDENGDESTNNFTLGEIGLRSRLTEHVGVFTGWRWWRYSNELDYASNLTITTRGPVVGLSFVF